MFEWQTDNVDFEEELARVLPADIPNRASLIEKSAQHLRSIAAINDYMNLTRISSPRDAAIKHVLDSVLPWQHFSGARRVLDAGTGAGFPGIPLAIVLPEVQFVLSESVQKKARFVESVIGSLDLPNVEVLPERAESLALARRPQIVTARALAPVERLLDLFSKALAQGSRLLLYKGPDVEAELAGINDHRTNANILFRYDLPDGLGARCLLSVSAAPRKRAQANLQ
jgi:16S rRNA (guanine527-N7)-methyltransferase